MNERFKEIRLTHKMSQKEFGKKIGIESRAHISSLESGNRNITDRIINDICREFNVSEDWLRYGKGDMYEQLSNQEKLMKYTAFLLKDSNSKMASAIQTLIITYEQLDDSSKAVLEKIALQYLENQKKSQ